MRTIYTVLALSLLVAAAPAAIAAAGSDDPPAEARSAPVPASAGGRILMPEQPLGERASRPALSPMMQEIQAALDADREQVAALDEQLKAAVDEQAALDILRRIHRQKQETELGILRIQQRYAGEKGDTDAVRRIDEAIDRILNPPHIAPRPEAEAERRAHRGGVGNE